MAYTATTWVNRTPPPINATNLNNIETGMAAAHAAALYGRHLWGPLLPSTIGSMAFGTIGLVYLVPIDVRWPITIDQIMYQVGAAQAGNVRMGIYREGAAADSPAGAALVVESASVAQSAINCVQMVPLAIPTALTRGQYFIGLQGDNVLGTFQRSVDAATLFGKQHNNGGAYGAFVNPCPAIAANATVPFFGLRISLNQPVI